jgi:ABC-type oligopeptide transport system substrate-binding subunit
MIESQAAQFDPEVRSELLKDIQRYVLDQAYLFSPITGASRWVFNQDVKGFYPNTALSEYSYWSRVWLDR